MSCCVRIPWDVRIMSCRMWIPWHVGVMSCCVGIPWDMGVMSRWVWVRVMSRSMRITWMMARWVVGGVMSSAMRVAWVMPCRVMVATVTTIVISCMVRSGGGAVTRIVVASLVYGSSVVCKPTSTASTMRKSQCWDMYSI